MRFYTTEQIGPTRFLTPEGFLVCKDVVLARTGTMIYGPHETPVAPGPDGVAHITRTEKEVFRPETVDSFNGKPFVDNHPPVDVDPENWLEFSKGSVLGPHRGTGDLRDCLVGDLIVYDKFLIQELSTDGGDGGSGKRELSCGYDAKYAQTAPGEGFQYDIVGNHVALVEKGRCGSRCAIGDAAYSSPVSILAVEIPEAPLSIRRRIMKWFDKLKKAVDSGDQAATAAVIDEIAEAGSGAKSETHVHVHTVDKKTDDAHGAACDCKDCKDKRTGDSGKTMDAAIDARFKKVEDGLAAQATATADLKTTLDKVAAAVLDESSEEEYEEGDKEEEEEDSDKKRSKDGHEIEFEAEAPEGTGDKAWKVTDSRYLVDSFEQTIALAEIILPGVSVPTVDSSAPRKKTFDQLCGFRRRVLDQAYTQDVEVRDFVDSAFPRLKVGDKKTPCSRVRDAFLAVGNFKRAQNNDSAGTGPASRAGIVGISSGNGLGVKGKVKTPADLNKELAEFYK